jgi:AbrB family looped-hinge helix DNA binding protein
MSHSTLTSKGQTTIPQEIREAVGLQTGAKLNWSVTPDGVLIVRAKTQSIVSLAGSLKTQDGKKISIQDMNPWK